MPRLGLAVAGSRLELASGAAGWQIICFLTHINTIPNLWLETDDLRTTMVNWLTVVNWFIVLMLVYEHL